MRHDWYKRFRAARKRRWYSEKAVGATLPATHLRRPTRAQILAAAKRFVRDGEMENAIEMVRLAYLPQQLNLWIQRSNWKW